MKKISLLLLSLLLILSGCVPSFNKQEDVDILEQQTGETGIIPQYKISDEYYQTLLPFKESASRGLVVSNIGTRYDLNEFETGLMRVATNVFDVNKYVFQEGQYLDSTTIRRWLNRTYSEEQLEENGIDPINNIGLNPYDDGSNSVPKYLAHVLEHDYLTVDSEGVVKLGGMVIGLALNSVYYYQKEAYGAYYETKITQEELIKQGQLIAKEVLNRLRSLKGLEDIPITIALFEQEAKTSIVPGHFIAYASAEQGSNQLGDWIDVKEEYILFPSNDATNKQYDDAMKFASFKQDIETYFPNYNGVVGTGFYKDNQLNKLSITVTMQFYGKSELVGFTQYVVGLLLAHFPDYIQIEVNLESVNGKEALIIKKPNDQEPFVYIYQ